MKGSLFIISSPSGGGKGTLIREILNRVPDVGYSISFTTRQPRLGEVHGKHYYFVGLKEFENLIAKGEFLEYANVHGNFYGTSRGEVEKELLLGRDVILEIDVQGAESIKRLMPESVSVFILPPDFETLRERLIRRGTDAPEVLAVRLKNAPGEIRRFTEFDYVIVNDEKERAFAQLAAIFYAERARAGRMIEAAQQVLDTFPKSD
ncbi:MAG TPA: guanylate kinase [Pyrinomonadaceae bacterium]|nr:guanylate kinase [Pyrinomonadaceae bacterium]